MEGFVEKTGESCSGHGACIREALFDESESALVELSEATMSESATITLTLDEQKESLGSKWVFLMEEAQRGDLPCKVTLKTEYSTNKCKAKETFGCVEDGLMNKMYVRGGCHGLFMNGDIQVRCSAMLPGTYGECSIFPGYECNKGQGEDNKDKILDTITVKSRQECASKCRADEDCVAFDLAKGLAKKNCRLYLVNSPRIKSKEDIGGQSNFEYCVVPPKMRYKACGEDNICGVCACSAGWGGFGCEIDLKRGSGECSPTEPGCIHLPPALTPCFGQVFEFPLDHPCRNPHRVHVPRPPEQPPLIDGDVPSYKDAQSPAAWAPPGEEKESGSST